MKHGHARVGKIDPLHRIWRAMLQRCENPRDKRYPSYGGRGIRVCERWHEFVNFLADVGPRPRGKTPGGRAAWQLDRDDNDGNYEPGNVSWLHFTMQAKKSTRSRLLTFRGRTMIIADWGRELGILPITLHRRLKAGWSIEKAFTEPLRVWS